MEDESFQDLKELAKKQGLSIGEFTEYLIDYAKISGINPQHPEKSIEIIMTENNKRLNQVIAFMRQHEDKALYKILSTNNAILTALNTFTKLEALKTP